MGWLLSTAVMLPLIVLTARAVLFVNSYRIVPTTVTGFPSPQGSVHGQPQVGSPSTPGPGPGGSGRVGGVGGIRRNRAGWREWRRADPTLINSLWKSKMGHGIRKQLGNAEVYIILALLIGLVTVVIGCWLSDNCWSPEPEHVVTVA